MVDDIYLRRLTRSNLGAMLDFRVPALTVVLQVCHAVDGATDGLTRANRGVDEIATLYYMSAAHHWHADNTCGLPLIGRQAVLFALFAGSNTTVYGAAVPFVLFSSPEVEFALSFSFSICIQLKIQGSCACGECCNEDVGFHLAY